VKRHLGLAQPYIPWGRIGKCPYTRVQSRACRPVYDAIPPRPSCPCACSLVCSPRPAVTDLVATLPLTHRNLAEWLDSSVILRPAMLWSVVAVLSSALVLAAAILAYAWFEGPQPQSSAPPAVSVIPRRDGLLLAGSGSNLPLTRLLATACSELPVTVDAGMGSTGGMRALADGVIDIALVSRSLRPAEQKPGLRILPYARTAIAVAVHPGVPVTDVTTEQLVEIFRGKKTTWPNALPIVPLQRERGDSSHEAVGKRVPEFAIADAQAWRLGRWRFLYHDRSMHEALLATPGAIGLVDASAVRADGLPLKLLGFDGVAPTAAAMAQGQYRLTKDLAFVLREPVSESAARWLACVASTRGTAVIRRAGSIPLLPASAVEVRP